VPASELDRTARQLVAAWTDKSNPDNWLKRPAKRTCLHCGNTWMTRMKLLASDAYCSDQCREDSRKLCEEAQSYLRDLRQE